MYVHRMTMVDMTEWMAPDADAPNGWGRFPNGTGPFSSRAVVTKGLANL